MKLLIHPPYRTLFAIAAALLVSIAFQGCAPSTQITGAWKSPEAASKQYNNLVIVAMTNNVVARQQVENDLQAQLQKQGVTAAKSIELFPPTSSGENGPDVNAIMEKVRSNGYDGIMTVALVDQEKETRYVPGNYTYAPITRFGWYGRFSGYYTYWSPMMYDPGYYTEDKIYFLEANLYDVETENLVWSAQSSTYNPSDLQNASQEFAQVTVERMGQDNVVSRQ
ncbi:hypothetical protein [Pontibacter sp. HJ8]